METLEKFKYYSDLLFQYISTRFGLLKFSGFAILLALLGTTELMNWETFGINALFIFASLFVFRLVDDVWSFHLDRINHPERTYLLFENIKIFVVFAAVNFIFYQIALSLFSPFLAVIILILLVISTLFYILFFKVKRIMKIIPLLKYPVLIWCASRFSMTSEVMFLSAGAFFMVFTSDFIDENRVISSKLILKLVLLIATGILIFQPWVEGSNPISNLIFISIPILLVAFTSIKCFTFYPIIIFPILHIINLII